MSEPLPDTLQAALDDLTAQRDLLNEDIGVLRRIIDRRRTGEVTRSAPPVDPAPRRSVNAAAGPGEARREILELMANGAVWTPTQIAQKRSTSPNAATRALRRMLAEIPPPVVKLRDGAKYKIASPKGDAQGSLPVETGGNNEE